MDTVGNLAAQRDLYGNTLVDIVAPLMTTLALNQARMAEVLGLSAPMLSQLLSGQRVKIGNPTVLHRLQTLAELAEDATSLPADEVAHRLAAIRDEQSALITRTDHARHADALGVLRLLAEPYDLRRAAVAVAAAGVPAVATLLEEAAGASG